jgi:hypothetical protein
MSAPPLGFGLPPSRRAADAPYALWVLSHNALALAAMLALDALASAWRMRRPGVSASADDDVDEAATLREPPRLVRAVSRRMLPTFLAANVMTVRRA